MDKHNRIWEEVAADKSGKTSTPTADFEILRGTLAEILVAKAQESSAVV